MSNNRHRSNCTANTSQPRQLLPRTHWAFAPAIPPQSSLCQVAPFQAQEQMMVEQEKRALDAWTTKLARTKRKMARQFRAHLKSSSSTTTTPTTSLTPNHYSSLNSTSSSSSSPSSASVAVSPPNRFQNKQEEAQALLASNVTSIDDLYTFFSPDNKRLRFVLKKELKNSDVGSLGRIVLPKREAEDKLPSLFDKEGIQLIIKDVYSNKQWCLKYKYWSNNKSRMYVLENTVDFVKQNGLEMGDSVALYEDECKNLYYVAMKKADKVTGSTSSTCNLPSNTATQTTTYDFSPNNTTNHTLHTYGQFRTGNEEDMVYLNNQNQVNANNETNLLAASSSTWSNDNSQLQNYMDFGVLADNNNYNNSDFAGSVNGDGMKVGDEILDDCYGDLGTLPEINYYNYYYGSGSLFDGVCSD